MEISKEDCGRKRATACVEPNEWVRHFQDLFSRDSNRGLAELHETHMIGPLYTEELECDFTKLEVKGFTIRMKNNKVSGYDGAPVEFWKVFCNGEQGIGILTNTFNKIKNGKQFPLAWKTAITHPIYKGKENRDKPGNYRGISLLSVCGKIFSGILARRVCDWLISHKRLSRFQAGYIKGKRTTDNILVIRTTIDKYLRFKRGRLYWCFVDLEKAFDSIDRDALWYKLRRKGISDNMVECIREMHEGIKFCVKCGEDVVTYFI
jgi:hypothetical protein